MLGVSWFAPLQETGSEWPEWLPWVAIVIVAFVAAFILMSYFESLRRLAKKWGGAYGGEELLQAAGCDGLPMFSLLRQRVRGVAHGRTGGLEAVAAHLDALEGEIGSRGMLACLRLPGQSLPRFALAGGPDEEAARRASFKGAERFTRAAGFVEVRLEGNPAIGRFFNVRLHSLEEEQQLRQVLTREIQDWLMLHREREWHIEGAGEWVAFLDSQNGAGLPSVLEAWLKEVRPLYELFARATSGAAKEGQV